MAYITVTLSTVHLASIPVSLASSLVPRRSEEGTRLRQDASEIKWGRGEGRGQFREDHSYSNSYKYVHNVVD